MKTDSEFLLHQTEDMQVKLNVCLEDETMSDSCLRFMEVGNGTFRCPVCGTVLKAVTL